MNAAQAHTLALQLMNKHGLSNQGWYFKFDNAKRRLGQCNYTRRCISLSYHWVELQNESQVKNTILHEIAHALTPGHKHDHVWRRKAIEIGCDGNRLFDSKGMEKPKALYEAVCNGCKSTFSAHRMRRKSSSCAKCSGGRYNENYKLVFKLVK